MYSFCISFPCLYAPLLSFENPRISLSHIPVASILFLTIVLVPVVQWAMSKVSVGGEGGYWSNKLVLG